LLFMSKSTGGITVSEGAHARPASSPVCSMSCLARCVIISHPLALSAEITTQHPARSTATTLHKRQCSAARLLINKKSAVWRMIIIEQ